MFRGEQYHTNNPSELMENFYLCAARAISSKVMLELKITCVINATLELPTFAYQKQECMQIAVEDKVNFDMNLNMNLLLNNTGSDATKNQLVLCYVS